MNKRENLYKVLPVKKLEAQHPLNLLRKFSIARYRCIIIKKMNKMQRK